MRIEPASVGRERTEADGGRRYRTIEITFDTRANLLEDEDMSGWDTAVREQHEANRANIIAGLLAEYGEVEAERKLTDFRALGAAPFSIVAEHNTLLGQVRDAFVFGAYYPALVGAAALGERIINELVLTLRTDYATHPQTSRRIRNAATFTDWRHPLEVLTAWGVVDDATAALFSRLETIRHDSVHYTSVLASGVGDTALEAIRIVQRIVTSLFGSLYRKGITIDGTPGVIMLRRDAEDIPLIRRFMLPRAVLVSPRHAPKIEQHNGMLLWTVYDDADYPLDEISDSEYAARLPAEMGEIAALTSR